MVVVTLSWIAVALFRLDMSPNLLDSFSVVVSVSAGDADAEDLLVDVGLKRSFCTVATNGEFRFWYKSYSGRYLEC
jgi:hypothetical protein